MQSHTVVPSFMARSAGKTQNVELEWDGKQYSAALTDTNGVLSRFRFTANVTGVSFSVSGNQLTITAKEAPADAVQITATRSQMRSGVIAWTDGNIGGGKQDTVTYSASVSDPVTAYLNLKVSYGSARIVKTSEDGKVDGITFTITGEGVNQAVTTGRNGEIQIDNLKPGVYTVTEQGYDQYEPQEARRVTVVSGRTATVSFNNTLKRRQPHRHQDCGGRPCGECSSFRLSGTSLSGLPVDEYASDGCKRRATFENVLIGTGYTLEEIDTAERYVVPDSQTAAVEWNTVTNKSFSNILKKWNVTVTKSDHETGTGAGRRLSDRCGLRYFQGPAAGGHLLYRRVRPVYHFLLRLR